MTDKSIYERLLLKPGRSLAFLNAPTSIAALGELPPFARINPSIEQADVAIFFVHSLLELTQIMSENFERLHDGEILWVAFPKKASGSTVDLDRDHLSFYLDTHGLEGRALISLDETWSALRVKRK